MPFVLYNSNPENVEGIDCTVRAISAFLKRSWDDVYISLAVEGYIAKNMPNANSVWSSYLRKMGCLREIVPNSCPDCYTVSDFANDHPAGRYLLATGNHVVAVIDGDYLDTWDSGREIPFYCWTKGDD